MKGQKVVDIAFAQVGYLESPKNSNKTKYGKWFGFDGVAWCGMFCSWVYDQAGVPLGNIGFSKGFAGCQTAVAHFKKTSQITKDPQVGDLVFFDWNADTRYDHVGLFNGWKDKVKGDFYTIEGNTSLSNQSNGGEVMSRTRTKSQAIFVHPKVLD
jgi:CHAP domain